MRRAKMGLFGLKTGQRRDVRVNVATFERMLLSNVATLDINVAVVLETANNRRRDVEISRHDVPEMFKINVATLGTHVATFQRV